MSYSKCAFLLHLKNVKFYESTYFSPNHIYMPLRNVNDSICISYMALRFFIFFLKGQ